MHRCTSALLVPFWLIDAKSVSLETPVVLATPFLYATSYLFAPPFSVL